VLKHVTVAGMSLC